MLSAASAVSIPAQIDRDMDLAAVRRAVAQGEQQLARAESEWRARLRAQAAEVARAEHGAPRGFAALFGYDPPGTAVTLAWLRAFLYGEQRRAEDARAAAAFLLRMAAYRDAVPDGLYPRVEYADGGPPPVPSFFQLADYAEAWQRVRDFDGHDPAARTAIGDAIARSAEFVFVFPEWGAHNRAVLRAESLLQAALALPDHDRAPRWRKMARILAGDSLGRFQIEDAQHYQPIWLLALLRYADAAGERAVLSSLPVRHSLRAFQELLSPAGTVPDFGDAWWNGSLERTYVCLEWGAAALADPELKWAARRVYRAIGPFDRDRPGLSRARIYAQLHGRIDPALEPREPAGRSGPVLDDVIGKKLVFRTGRGDDDLYLLLNYRDEGDWGRTDRDYLRQTLAVEEEKTHHGHADENAIVLFMDRGSVLLHDGGYRDAVPSGPFGAYRADIFHNRLVARAGKLAPGQGLLEFLRDSGAYRPVRTELIDFVAAEQCDYGRTRVTDDELGTTWDRIVVFPREPRLIVVIDAVRADRPGYRTFATLWATRELAARGPGFAVGAIDRIDAHELPRTRELLLAFPGTTGEPGVFGLHRHRQDEHVVHRTASRAFDAGSFVAFVTVLWPIERGADAAARAARIARIETDPTGGRAIGLTIRDASDGTLVTIGCKLDRTLGLRDDAVRPRYDPERGRVRYGGTGDDAGDATIETDADLVVVRRRGSQARWSAVNMTHVRIANRTAFEAQPFQVFQTSGRSDVVGRSKWRRWDDTLVVGDR